MATLAAPDTVAMDSQKLERVKQLFQQQIDEDNPGGGPSRLSFHARPRLSAPTLTADERAQQQADRAAAYKRRLPEV